MDHAKLGHVAILNGDALDELETITGESIDCCVTSPPYWGMRDYGVEGQIGLEPTPGEYVARLVDVFSEVWRVLKPDGTLWVNLGYSYCSMDKWGGGGANTGKHTRAPNGDVESWKAPRRRWSSIDGVKSKDLLGMPWRVAFALQSDGWYLRSDIIWAKPNPMPESVKDHPTRAHEYVFLLTKQERYYYDAKSISEPFADSRMGNPGTYRKTSATDRKIPYHPFPVQPFINNGRGWNQDGGQETRNARTIWTIPTQPYPHAHYATFPEELARRCILAGCPPRGHSSGPLCRLRHRRPGGPFPWPQCRTGGGQPGVL